MFPLQCSKFRAKSSNTNISKIKSFFWIFDCISEMCMKFRTFWKKRRVSQPIYLRNDGLRKRWLLKRLKGLASEDHAVINVLTGSKHCWNQQGTTIILFFHAFGIYWVGKSLHWSDEILRLLTTGLPTRSIPVAMCTISRNRFKRTYIKNKRLFLDFFLRFWNVHEI